jgi:small subunit ribosomal protein S21
MATGIVVRPNEPFEKAFKRFSRACIKSGIMSDVKKHQHYEKPSESRKRKIASARRKARKEMMKMQSMQQQLISR